MAKVEVAMEIKPTRLRCWYWDRKSYVNLFLSVLTRWWGKKGWRLYQNASHGPVWIMYGLIFKLFAFYPFHCILSFRFDETLKFFIWKWRSMSFSDNVVSFFLFKSNYNLWMQIPATLTWLHRSQWNWTGTVGASGNIIR